MTEQLHDHLTALADRAPVGPLDVAGLSAQATTRRRRRALLAVAPAVALLLVVPLAWASVGGGQDRLTQPAAPAPVATVVAVEDLQASVSAEVVTVGGSEPTLGVAVDPTPVPLDADPAQVVVQFTALAGEVSFAPFPSWVTEIASDEGDGVLGLAVSCGARWSDTGQRVTDPCGLALPVSNVAPDRPAATGLRLYPRVGDRQAAPGTYRTELELAGGHLLRVVVTVTERTATVSPLPEAIPPPSPAAVAPGFQQVEVFFTDTLVEVDCGAVQSATRVVPATESVATAALTELFRGPSPSEREFGLSGFGPETAGLLRSVRIVDGTAYVDLDRSLFPDNFGTSCGMQAFFATVGRTLTQFATINGFVAAFDGDPVAFQEFMQGSCPQEVPAPGDACDPTPFESGTTSSSS